jgi:hypothetical protein
MTHMKSARPRRQSPTINVKKCIQCLKQEGI